MDFEIPSLKYRLLFGLSFFIIVGVRDYIKNKENPQKAKEFSFIFSLSLFSILFAIFHDFVTYHISNEYFMYGKNLGLEITFVKDVIPLAITGSYWVGILAGAVLAIANNPYKDYPRMEYKFLYLRGLNIFFITLIIEFIAVILSFFIVDQFQIDGESYLKSPIEYKRVLIIHISTYAGVLLGIIFNTYVIIKHRLNLKRT